jgi:hypothetical protein
VNEYVTKFTQLSLYAPHEVDTDEKKQECFLNGLNDGLAYALEAWDFENFQGMVNKALVLENRRGAMECKHRLGHQHQPGSSSRPRVATPSAGPVFCPAQPLFQPRPQVAGQGYSTRSAKRCHAPALPGLLLLGIRMFRGLKPLRTHYRGNGGVLLAGRKVTLPTSVPIRATVHLWQLRPLLHLPMRQILFLLLLGRTTFVERSIMSQLRKPRKLRTWSSIHFPSTTSLQLCCFIYAAYVEKHNLPMALLRSQMIVSSPGGDMPVRQLCPKVNLKMRG